MVTRCTVLALLLVAVTAHAQQRPSFSVAADGVLAATLPLSVLQDKNVKKQLASGLTATFLVLARQREPIRLSGARMEIRYDLWDEVWLVRRIDFDGRSERQRITSMDALEKWWRTPLRLLTAHGKRVNMQIELNVLPFSAAEEEDARQGITKSGGVGTAGGGSGGIVDALIGSTISAKPITSYRWNVDLALP